MVDVVLRQVQWVNAPPLRADSAEACHRQALLRLCVDNRSPAGAKRLRRLEQALHCTGDLRSEGIVLFRPGPPPASRDLEVWATELVSLLLPRAVPVFQRHRWLSSLQPISEALLLSGVHRILQQAVPERIDQLRKTPAQADADAHTSAAAAPAPAASDEQGWCPSSDSEEAPAPGEGFPAGAGAHAEQLAICDSGISPSLWV